MWLIPLLILLVWSNSNHAYVVVLGVILVLFREKFSENIWTVTDNNTATNINDGYAHLLTLFNHFTSCLFVDADIDVFERNAILLKEVLREDTVRAGWGRVNDN